MKLGDFIPVDRDGRVDSAKESIARRRAGARKGLARHDLR